MTSNVLKSIFCMQYVDDTNRKRDENKKFFNALHSYHPNVTLTVKEKTTQYLDTKITRENDEIKTQSIF